MTRPELPSHPMVDVNAAGALRFWLFAGRLIDFGLWLFAWLIEPKPSRASALLETESGRVVLGMQVAVTLATARSSDPTSFDRT
jgi:hypothetical protein